VRTGRVLFPPTTVCPVAWAATVRRPRLLVGVFTAMNTMSAEAMACSTAVETCRLRPRQRPTTSARPGS
jgi:hypothetical protein